MYILYKATSFKVMRSTKLIITMNKNRVSSRKITNPFWKKVGPMTVRTFRVKATLNTARFAYGRGYNAVQRAPNSGLNKKTAPCKLSGLFLFM